MNTWTVFILILALSMLIAVSFYHCIPQRKMHRKAREVGSLLEKRAAVIYGSIFLLCALAMCMGRGSIVWGIFPVCCAAYVFCGTGRGRGGMRSLLILNEEVKGCFQCTLMNLAAFVMLAVYWKWEAVKLPRPIGAAAALNIVILLSLCLRLIWNGMISIDKVPRREEGIKIIFVNSFSIICAVLLVLSVSVYWLSVWDVASYQISGAVGSLTFIDALYYTVTTVTTVGYGDIIPNSEYSRLLAIAVQGIGLLIISGFAVNVISYITVKENR